MGKRCDLEHHLCCHHAFSGVPTTKGLCFFGGSVCVGKRCFAEKSRQLWRSPLPIASLYLKSTLPIAWLYACSSGECLWARCAPFGVWKRGKECPRRARRLRRAAKKGCSVRQAPLMHTPNADGGKHIAFTYPVPCILSPRCCGQRSYFKKARTQSLPRYRCVKIEKNVHTWRGARGYLPEQSRAEQSRCACI